MLLGDFCRYIQNALSCNIVLPDILGTDLWVFIIILMILLPFLSIIIIVAVVFTNSPSISICFDESCQQSQDILFCNYISLDSLVQSLFILIFNVPIAIDRSVIQPMSIEPELFSYFDTHELIHAVPAPMMTDGAMSFL